MSNHVMQFFQNLSSGMTVNIVSDNACCSAPLSPSIPQSDDEACHSSSFVVLNHRRPAVSKSNSFPFHGGQRKHKHSLHRQSRWSANVASKGKIDEASRCGDELLSPVPRSWNDPKLPPSFPIRSPEIERDYFSSLVTPELHYRTIIAQKALEICQS